MKTVVLLSEMCISLAKAFYVDPTGRESTLALSDTGLQGGRDGNYNITMRNTLHGTKTYDYDSANRLLEEKYEYNQSKNYTYNYAGNRKSVSGAVENGPYVYGSNSMNEITGLNTGVGAVSYGYDARGNLQSRGADMFYWDYKNRLISASVGGSNVGYKYSGGDLRLARTKDGVTTLYFYHGNSLIAEKTSDGKVRKVFTHDNGGVLGMTRYVYDETDTYKSKQNLYYMFDDLGSVTAITDDTGTPVQIYMYDAYGNVTNTQNDPINNFAFVGRYGGFRDWDTGLTQFLHRWYDSRDGRRLSRDPIGVEGGVNLYNYTENNPVNRVDVLGLDPKKDKCEKELGICVLNAVLPINMATLANIISGKIATDMIATAGKMSDEAFWRIDLLMRDHANGDVIGIAEKNMARGSLLKYVGRGIWIVGAGITVIDLLSCGVDYYSCCQGRTASGIGVIK